LQILAEHSYSDAASIPIESLGGLPAALLDLIEHQSRKRDIRTARRRLEAALILRNLVLQGDQACIDAVKPCANTIFRVLVEYLGNPDESLTELTLYLLDIAEVYAPEYTIESQSTLTPHLSHHKQIYPALAQAGQSNDRAVVIGAYTLLGALAVNEKNARIFLDADTADSSLLANRAIQLLPLNDMDLLLPLLEYLYQHTLHLSHASLLIQRSDIHGLFGLLASRIREGGTLETIEYESRRQSSRGKVLREVYMRTYPSLAILAAQDRRKSNNAADATLPEAILNTLLHLPEPERLQQWLKAAFEPHPSGEVTQVALWKAYQSQFEPYDAAMKAGQIPPMANASDVIRGSTEAFPEARPAAIDDPTSPNGKRFIIAGIRIRVRIDDAILTAFKDKWRCRWQGCGDTTQYESATYLYSHLQDAHISPLPEGQPTYTCEYVDCQQKELSKRALMFHLRTHIPPSKPYSQIGPSAAVRAADAFDHAMAISPHSSVRNEVADNGFAVGVGFVASLVLRNMSRAVASAASQYRDQIDEQAGDRERDAKRRHYTSTAAGYAEQQDERMLGFLSGKLVENEGTGQVAEQHKEHALSKEQLLNAVGALLSVEKDVILLAASDRPLATYLMETLECSESAKHFVNGLNR